MRFAKIYERDGKQVLVTKEQDVDTDEPCLQFRFKSNVLEHDIRTTVFFKGTVQEQWDSMDKAFETADEDFSFNVKNQAPGVNL